MDKTKTKLQFTHDERIEILDAGKEHPRYAELQVLRRSEAEAADRYIDACFKDEMRRIHGDCVAG